MHKALESKRVRTILIITVAAILMVSGYFAFSLYTTFFAGNVTGEQKYLYVHTGADYNAVMKDLEQNNGLKNMVSFKSAAKKMDLATSVKPGRYLLRKGQNNRSLINMLKAGNQEPVTLKIQNFRKKEDLAGFLGRKLEADSAAFIHLMDSAALVEKHGFTPDNSYTMYIPNSYEMYWNVRPEEFFNKMLKEYTGFWTAERKQKAAALKMGPSQVVILASIVDAEALYDKEMPTIAGLYLNRLHRGILLQADPTVIYANNDFTVKRVTNGLLRVDSRYNTYKYVGLPPGPIMMPSIRAIDAVLSPEQNDYIYMCAKEDFSGYHNFAANLAQHEINARKYREALNKRNIFK